jgi:hypothetical protein
VLLACNQPEFPSSFDAVLGSHHCSSKSIAIIVTISSSSCNSGDRTDNAAGKLARLCIRDGGFFSEVRSQNVLWLTNDFDTFAPND